MRTLRLASITILALASTVYAQETLRGPDGHTTYRVSGVVVLEIPNKPFTAKTSNDATEGQQVIRLREVSRSEPDPSQFAIPSGFSLEQAR